MVSENATPSLIVANIDPMIEDDFIHLSFAQHSNDLDAVKSWIKREEVPEAGTRKIAVVTFPTAEEASRALAQQTHTRLGGQSEIWVFHMKPSFVPRGAL
jgi:hypothetical protein